MCASLLAVSLAVPGHAGWRIDLATAIAYEAWGADLRAACPDGSTFASRPGSMVRMKGPSRTLFENLCADFETAWNAIATSDLPRRTDASFLFGRQAMLLVELVLVVTAQAPEIRSRFSAELKAREPRLFARIPWTWPQNKPSDLLRDWTDEAESDLVAVLFDLVRHGHAHMGHQTYAPLQAGGAFGIVLLGVEEGLTIDKLRETGEPFSEQHLAYRRQRNNQLVMGLCAGIFYVDVRDASESADVWQLDHDATGFARRRQQHSTVDELKEALGARQHPV